MQVYEGKEKYIYITYAHKDSALILPIVEALSSRGFRIWYDTGLDVEMDFITKIEERLSSAHCVLAFHSERLMQSRSCADEIAFAYVKNIPVVLALLEPAYPPQEIFYLACIQLHPYPHESAEAFADALAALPVIQACK